MRKKRNKILYLILFVSITNFAYAQGKSEKNIQIFIGGKEYSSFEKYNHERLKSLAQESFNENKNTDFTLFLRGFIRKLDGLKLENYSVEEIKRLFDQMLIKEAKTIEAQSDGSIEQMRGMLDEFYSKKGETVDYVINPSKVKTIIIKPSS